MFYRFNCNAELLKCLKQSHLEPINASVIQVTTLRIRGQLPATVANASKVCIPPYRSVSRVAAKPGACCWAESGWAGFGAWAGYVMTCLQPLLPHSTQTRAHLNPNISFCLSLPGGITQQVMEWEEHRFKRNVQLQTVRIMTITEEQERTELRIKCISKNKRALKIMDK